MLKTLNLYGTELLQPSFSALTDLHQLYPKVLFCNVPSTPATISKQQCPMPQVEWFFRQSQIKLNMLNLFRFCRKNEISSDNVAKTGNIVANYATMSKQHLTLSKGQYFMINSFNIVSCYHFWQQSWQELIRRWDSERELFNDDIAHT